MLSVWVAQSARTKPVRSAGPVSGSFAPRRVKRCGGTLGDAGVSPAWSISEQNHDVGGENTSFVPDSFPMHLLLLLHKPKQLLLLPPDPHWSSTS